MQSPKLGQDIYFHGTGGTLAAKVTKVLDVDTVNLIAFDDGSGALGAALHSYCGVARGEWSFVDPEPVGDGGARRIGDGSNQLAPPSPISIPVLVSTTEVK